LFLAKQLIGFLFLDEDCSVIQSCTDCQHASDLEPNHCSWNKYGWHKTIDTQETIYCVETNWVKSVNMEHNITSECSYKAGNIANKTFTQYCDD
jgi:hypothetical protein